MFTSFPWGTMKWALVLKFNAEHPDTPKANTAIPVHASHDPVRGNPNRGGVDIRNKVKMESKTRAGNGVGLSALIVDFFHAIATAFQAFQGVYFLNLRHARIRP